MLFSYLFVFIFIVKPIYELCEIYRINCRRIIKITQNHSEIISIQTRKIYLYNNSSLCNYILFLFLIKCCTLCFVSYLVHCILLNNLQFCFSNLFNAFYIHCPIFVKSDVVTSLKVCFEIKGIVIIIITVIELYILTKKKEK